MACRRRIRGPCPARQGALRHLPGLFCFLALRCFLWRGWRAPCGTPGAWGKWGWGSSRPPRRCWCGTRRVYGSPLHHWNGRLLWIRTGLPDYAEIYAPRALELLPHGFRDWAGQTRAGTRSGSGAERWATAETALHPGRLDEASSRPSPLGGRVPHSGGWCSLRASSLFLLGPQRLLYKAARVPSRARSWASQAAFFVALLLLLQRQPAAPRATCSRWTLCLYAVCFAVGGWARKSRVWLKSWGRGGPGRVSRLAVSRLDPSLSQSFPPGKYAGRRAAWLESHLGPGGKAYARSTAAAQPFEPENWFPARPCEPDGDRLPAAWAARKPIPGPAELLDHFPEAARALRGDRLRPPQQGTTRRGTSSSTPCPDAIPTRAAGGPGSIPWDLAESSRSGNQQQRPEAARSQ